MSYQDMLDSIIGTKTEEDFVVDNRTITGSYSDIVVTADNYSNKIWFTMPSIIDGISVKGKTIKIIYRTPDDYIDYIDPTDITYGTDTIRFSWFLSNNVARISGTVTFAIRVSGENYSWNTRPASLQVEQGILEDGDTPPEFNLEWVESVENKLLKLDNTKSSATNISNGSGTNSVQTQGTTAAGKYSMSEGKGTIARADCQHVQGKYNIPDVDGIYAFIIGNGISMTMLSNAHTVDWDGNAWYAGDVYTGIGSHKAKLVSETDLAKIFGTFSAVSLISGITCSLSVETLYKVGANEFAISVNNAIIGDVSSIADTLTIASTILGSNKTYISLYNSGDFLCNVQPRINGKVGNVTYGILFMADNQTAPSGYVSPSDPGEEPTPIDPIDPVEPE